MNAPPAASTFGDRLRLLREQRGLTQTDLSKDSGISQSTVSALETGRQRPWPSTRRALARAFGLSLDEFDRLVMAERSTPRVDTPVSIDLETPSPTVDLSRTVATLAEQLRITENRLRRSEQQLRLFRHLVDETPVLCWETDSELRVVSASGWALRRHQVWGDLVGRTLEDFHTRTAGRFPLPPIEPHRRALAGQSASVLIPCGEDVWIVVVEPILTSSGSVSGVIGMAARRERSG